MRQRDLLIVILNRLIDRQFHRYFDDPEVCLFAVGADVILHQAVEGLFGLPRGEIARRTARYLPKALERCMNAKLRSLWRNIK